MLAHETDACFVLLLSKGDIVKGSERCKKFRQKEVHASRGFMCVDQFQCSDNLAWLDGRQQSSTPSGLAAAFPLRAATLFLLLRAERKLLAHSGFELALPGFWLKHGKAELLLKADGDVRTQQREMFPCGILKKYFRDRETLVAFNNITG